MSILRIPSISLQNFIDFHCPLSHVVELFTRGKADRHTDRVPFEFIIMTAVRELMLNLSKVFVFKSLLSDSFK